MRGSPLKSVEALSSCGFKSRFPHQSKALRNQAIKNARLKQNLTQEELGERIGVKRSQICKLESGKYSITLSTMGKVFRALGIATATLDLGVEGKVALW